MSESKLDTQTLDIIHDKLLGTCGDTETILENMDIEADFEAVEIDLEDMNLEKCPICGWWMDSWELLDDDNNVVGCEDCRKPDAERDELDDKEIYGY